MKKFFGLLCALSLFLSLPGCGRSSETSNALEGSSQTEIQQYDEMIKAEEEGAVAPGARPTAP